MEFDGRWKEIDILTMWQISEFKNILDSAYIRIGLPVYVKFALGEWISSRQKIIQIVEKNESHASNRKRVFVF